MLPIERSVLSVSVRVSSLYGLSILYDGALYGRAHSLFHAVVSLSVFFPASCTLPCSITDKRGATPTDAS